MKKIYLLLFVVGVLFLVTGCDNRPSKLDMTKQSPVTFKRLTYNLIDGYRKGEDVPSEDGSNYEMDFYYMESKEEMCSLDVSTFVDYQLDGHDLEYYAKQQLIKYQIEKDNSRLKTGKEVINGVTWLLAIYEGQDGTTEYSMVALYNGEFYILHYADMGKARACANIIKNTKSSFRFS